MEIQSSAPVGNASAIKSFEFTGNAREYFSIWIVNICLTILTLGIYSAWAKVRTNQYFYGNTQLDGASFRYLANPIQILKGRIIAFTIFVVYYLSGMIAPMAAGITMLIIMLFVPAMLVMSMAFRMRNSAYRNVKFNFEKNYKKAYFLFSLPLLIFGIYFVVLIQFAPQQAVGDEQQAQFPFVIAIMPLIIMFLFPWWEYLMVKFQVVHARFGISEFLFSAKTREYYMMYLKPFVIMILAAIAFAVVFGGMAAYFGAQPKDTKPDLSSIGLIIFPIYIGMMLLYLWFFAYITTKRTNLVYNNITIAGHKLKSQLKVGYMMYLYVTNTLAIVSSLGLLMPWAKIRTARYRASMTSLEPDGDLNNFTAVQASKQSALGEEVGEMFDMDLGL